MNFNAVRRILWMMLLTVSAIAVADAQSGPSMGQASGGGSGKGTLTGIVKEKGTGIPMEYTSVAVYRAADSSLVDGTVTNNEGVFKIDDLPFGKYYIVSNFVGYNKLRIDDVKITPDNREVNLGTIQMSLNTQSLDEVEIVADQRRVEYKLDKKVVNVGEDLNAASGTAVDVLENTPSVTVDIEGNVTLRGSGSFTVLINGKPSVLEGSEALQQIPASSIRNIEIITNPSVKYDPDGNAGIINVVLKEQSEKGTTGIVNASAGWRQKYRIDALINRRTGDFNFFVGANYSDNLFDGSLERTHVSFSDTTNIRNYRTASGNFDFHRKGVRFRAGATYDINEKNSISLEGSGGNYGFGINRTNSSHEYTDPASGDLYYYNVDLMNRDGLYYDANLTYTHNFDKPEHKLQFVATYSNRDGDEVEDQEYYITDETYNVSDAMTPETKSRNLELGGGKEFRAQLDYTLPLGENSKFEAGYQARIDDDLEQFIRQEYINDVFVDIDSMSSNIDFFRNIQGAYVMYSGMLNKLQYQVGLRGEYTYRKIYYDNFDRTYGINRFDYYPTVHLARQFRNDNQLMASYSKRVERPRGYHLDSIPSYIDKNTIRIGNPRLEPEYVNSVELGYQKGWGKNFLAYELFYRNTQNKMTRVIEYDAATDISYHLEKNIGSDHSIGSEIMVNWELAKWLKMNAGVSGYYYRINAELAQFTIDTASFNWDGNLNTTFSFSSTARLQVDLGYRGPTVTAQGSAKGFAYMNLAARKDFFNRKLSATLQIRDLFGSMKRDFTSYGDNFEQHIVMRHEPRIVMLSLSYKINNYRPEKMSENNGESGGMEMDSGF